jgi:cytochrome c biogenesis protein CcmG/thiol:disulfide interchange protein DsbE
MNKATIPIAIFVILVLLFAFGLLKDSDPNEFISPLVGKPIPQFTLKDVNDPSVIFSDKDLRGKVTFVNVWASWCHSCLQEHEMLRYIAQEGYPIYAINYKNKLSDAQKFLKKHGNPYVKNGHDLDGRAGFDWGVRGAPETFIVDQKGIIQFKYDKGPITREVWEAKLLPCYKALQQGASTCTK